MKSKIIPISLLLFMVSVKTLYGQSSIAVNSSEVNALLQKDEKIVILDVRTADEFSQGHIKGSMNMDMLQPGMLDSINKLDKNANYIVYCRTKNRSGVVVNSMLENGFKTVYQMMDGITGWNQNSLPVVK